MTDRIAQSYGQPVGRIVWLGERLIRRAREHGLTSTDLTDILGIPIHRIRTIYTTADLDALPVGALRTLAQRLDLDWPKWLGNQIRGGRA